MKVLVDTPQGLSGRLLQADGEYLFSFDANASEDAAPALGMPLRPLPFRRKSLFPVFQMNLPEGFVLEQIKLRLAKAGIADPLLLLSVIGSQSPIGRLRFNLESPETSGLPVVTAGRPGVRLADLLANKGSKALFARLVDDFVLRSGLSGVQPKVLVPEAPPAQASAAEHLLTNEKAAVTTGDLIVKSGLDVYPGFSINEFFCMSVVKRAGLPVPEFFLSEDGELFIMRRFDRPADGSRLGFEDMAALAGVDTDEKYKGSYKTVLKLLSFYCSPGGYQSAKSQLFDMVALSCILGNGDAHLKNFGVLYEGVRAEVAMAPAYDIVCTRLYIPDDTLALTLDGSKVFFAARQGLLSFGVECGLKPNAIGPRLAQLAQLTLDMLEEMADTVARLPGLRNAIEPEALLYRRTFAGGA